MAVYPSIISLNRAQTFKAPWQEVLVSHWHQISVLSHFCASDHGVPTWNTLALLHLPKSSLPSKSALVPLLLETLITISSKVLSYAVELTIMVSSIISLFRNLPSSDTFIYSTNPEYQLCDGTVLGAAELQPTVLVFASPKELLERVLLLYCFLKSSCIELGSYSVLNI